MTKPLQCYYFMTLNFDFVDHTLGHASNDQLSSPIFCESGGHLNSFVCLSVCPSVCLSKNFNLAHIFWSINDRALIFDMHDHYDKPFILVPCFDLDLSQGQICCRAGDHNSSNLLLHIETNNFLAFFYPFIWLWQLPFVWELVSMPTVCHQMSTALICDSSSC